MRELRPLDAIEISKAFVFAALRNDGGSYSWIRSCRGSTARAIASTVAEK